MTITESSAARAAGDGLDERQVEGVFVLATRGTFHEFTARLLIDRIRAHIGDALIVDLRSVHQLSVDAGSTVVSMLLAGRDHPEQCCVVVRGTDRAEVFGARPPVATFMSVGDALQARALEQAGYGDGWVAH